MIWIKWLIFSVLQKKWRFEDIEQARFLNITVRIVNKGTWFCIAIGINVEVTSAACDTTVNIISIVPKINRQNRFLRPELSYLLIHIFSLLRSYQKVYISIFTQWHIRKVPAKQTAFVD